ncbi:hypothetical protein BU24DRAFT_248168 [Aaosphaeria arxii CBS 175.79]|uniref:Survival Motor Neuron Gemin2-binding domain-containing protein n=1 Tax=Aaosphaeria arxii CBS 175.79 TaxID=1450172 RepID=A0A6A5XLZ5_9PLEO|nr:uncharacterized protein BU24DRAFT_248168 [Aaosphaeria arxii CBS 175.79]KAF2013831.1 hypothetical protein BU24DRAFT_248168 [Aaosphaeria arxii CBS 175.79]
MATGISLDDHNAWDDSALIDSWDEAVAEYKKYHSIQAQGKRLEDVLSAEELQRLREEGEDVIEEADGQPNSVDQRSNADFNDPETADLRANGKPGRSFDKVSEQEAADPANQETSSKVETDRQHTDIAASMASMPQAMLGTVKDENLKNLMMSWYYAGYYTGLYTGQQTSASKE